MSISRIRTYLHSIVKQTENHQANQNHPEFIKRKAIFLKVLHEIDDQLDSAKEGEEFGKLIEAVAFIESIRIKGFLCRTATIRKITQTINHPVLDIPNYPRAASAPILDAAFQGSILTIHANLIRKLNRTYRLYMPKWYFTYPLEHGEIMNNPIGDWQNAYMDLLPENAAHSDYQRNISIQGLAIKRDDKARRIPFTEEEIISAIQQLVSETDYLDRDKPLLEKWLNCNGNQEVNRFIHGLFLAGHFSEIGDLPGDARSLEQGWFINDNKKIICRIDLLIFTVTHGLDYLIAMDPDASTPFQEDYGKIMDDVSEYLKLREKYPLMRIKSIVELEVNEEHRVRPKVVLIHARGFTHLLKPSRQLLETKKRDSCFRMRR